MKRSDFNLKMPENIGISLIGTADETAKWIEKNQLLDEVLWAKFAGLFASRAENDGGWRGEYWGKMMRGAVTVYQYTQNDRLYKVLEKTVRNMLKTQSPDGNITAYTPEREFSSWDMWCRKYVMLGMEFFLEICRNEKLAKRITRSVCRQCDYIMRFVGNGKKPITETSRFWGGMNSSSVLEPVVRLYRLTGRKKYLSFANHIIKEGGSLGINIFDLARKDEKAPFEYGVSKAYEMTSCFEGLLEYYYATGKRSARLTVERFARQVMKSDLTVIGSAGCTHELFDNSFNRQTTTEDGIMQETCVTVTLMKFFRKMFLLTGDTSYADALEKAYYNAYLGTLNFGGYTAQNEKSRFLDKGEINYTFIPFDSYSPLAKGTRGRAIGGFQILPDRTYYGCCACIASAGSGLFNQSQIFGTSDGIFINGYNDGKISLKYGESSVSFTFTGGYPYGNGTADIAVGLESETEFTLRLRSPQKSRRTAVTVGGTEYSPVNGVIEIHRKWNDGDRITVSFDTSLHIMKAPVYGKTTVYNIDWSTLKCYPVEKTQKPEEEKMISLSRGPLVLALEQKLSGRTSLRSAPKSCGNVKNTSVPGYRFSSELKLENGEKVTVCDYASAGKTWDGETALAAWFVTDSENTQP